MDPHIWKKPWSRLLKGKAIEVETPELYLKFTRRCMEQVNRLCLARGPPLPKFNQEQCKYLAIKLQLAIQSANSIIKDVNKKFLSLIEPKEMEQFLEIFKLLSVMGMEVEGFIQNCCKEAWIQSAIMITNTLEQVAIIGLNLECCTNIFWAIQSQSKIALTHFDVTRIREVEFHIVKEKVDIDAMKLIMGLRNVIESNATSSAEWQLATFLLGRLETVKLPQDINLSRSHERALPLMITNLQQRPDCLGKGTFGSVHKALWFGVEVAKKTFYAPTSADFSQEVSILDGLNHPNIVSLLWSMTDGKRCHLVMELMDEDLFSLMLQRMEANGNQGPPFNIHEALDLILQIGEGMLYLHEKRIVHRDLKSHNILIRCGKMAKGRVQYLHVKVADFGLSKTKEHSATYSNLTTNVGTTRWMAPEVMRIGNIRSGDDIDEEREVTLNYPFKIDIYSFGMVCYEILTGEVPFSNLSHGEVKEAVLRGDRPLLPRECPNRLKSLIKACWSGEASIRPSFGNICEELRDLKYANLQIYWKALLYQCPLKDLVTIDELVAKLSSPIEDIQRSVVDDISLLAEKSFDHRIYIKEQEVIPLLVLLHYSRYLQANDYAFIALHALLVDDEVNDWDIEHNLIPRIHSLKELSLLHRSRSKDVSRKMLLDDHSRKMLLVCAIGPIVEVLKSGRMKARENAAQALIELSFDWKVDVKENVIEKIGNSGAMPTLVMLLEDGSREGKVYAAIILFQTCLSQQHYTSVVQMGIVPPLMNLIAQQSSYTMWHRALCILNTLVDNCEGLIAIATIGPIPILVKIITSESLWNASKAAKILLKLCLQDQRFIKEARELNVVEHLTNQRFIKEAGVFNVVEHLTDITQHPQGQPSLPSPELFAIQQLLQEGEENGDDNLQLWEEYTRPIYF